MKLVVFCLFAVCCTSLANTSTNERKTDQLNKLKEVLIELEVVKEMLQHNAQMLPIPPQNTEDCCCVQCFRANMAKHFNINERNRRKLYRSLNHTLTVEGLGYSGNAQCTCQNCSLHPKENVTAFFGRLESVIQKGITRLMMN